VRLGPIPDDAVPAVLRSLRSWMPQATEATARERIGRSATWDDHVVELGISVEGRTIGTIQARRCPRTMFPGIYEIGIELWGESDRGKGLGRDAVGAITRYLFDEEAARRVQLTTDLSNDRMRRAAERLGFRLEGILRAYEEGPDGPHDFAMYGMTRPDYEEESGRWT
jgi:ribosomal-protein-serine acetyltransferase